MLKKKIKPSPADRVLWTNPASLHAMMRDIDVARWYGAITPEEATTLRHDICQTWGVLYL